MSLLEGYYAALNAENDARGQAERAQARNTNAQTGEVAANAAAQRGLQGSEAGLNRAKTGQVGADSAAARQLQAAQSGLYGAQAGVLPLVSRSENALRASQVGLNQTAQQLSAGQLGLGALGGGVPTAAPGGDANGDPTDTSSSAAPDTNAPGSGGGSGGNADPTDNTDGLAKGGKVMSKKSVIQGKAPKPGPTDTVPAMLTPGEAVLNKGAAEHYGSDVIDHMNKMGLLRMGAQSEVAKASGLPDPHAKHQIAPTQSDAKKKPGSAKGKLVAGGAAPTGNAMPVPLSPQPAGGAAAPGPGALPGFWRGTSDVTPSSAGVGMIPWTQTPAPTMQGSTDLMTPHYGSLASPPTAQSVIMMDHGLGGLVALPTMTPR